MKMQICESCGKDYLPSRGPSKKRRQRFCSNACRGKTIRGENNPLYKGGSVQPSGYRLIPVDGKRVLEHRHVMESHLGRPLLPTEVVHHKDGNKLNNSIENLQLLGGQAEHCLVHFTGYRTETHKQCKKCLYVRPRTEFHAGRKGRKIADPHHTECKQCRAAYYAERWRKGLTSQQQK